MVGKNLDRGTERAHEITAAIAGLQSGDRVIVIWHDACRVNNDPDVRAEYYSTRKETQGTVFDCLPDPEYPNVFYLIISGETTSGHPDYYDSIPVAWIAQITRLEVPGKQPKKVEKLAPDNVEVERVVVYKGGKEQEDSGGVEKLPRKWTQPSVGARKFTEELTKIVR